MIGKPQITCVCDRCGNEVTIEFEVDFPSGKHLLVNTSIIKNELRVWYDWSEVDALLVCDICKIEEE